jgi:hypothetical protein
MYSVQGGCHCGNISYVAEFTKELSTYKPRACDCDFCTSHGSSYVSDRNGSLIIEIKNICDVSKYRQGSRIADFLICKNCGVMIGVCYEEDGRIFGSINVRSSAVYSNFGETQTINLLQLSDEERISRWKQYWFEKVLIKYKNK